MEEVIGKTIIISSQIFFRLNNFKLSQQQQKSGGDVALGMIAGAAIGSSLGWGWGHHHGKILKYVEL